MRLEKMFMCLRKCVCIQKTDANQKEKNTNVLEKGFFLHEVPE